MRYVVCYDIADDRRRARIAKLMLDYGKRMQYSVFECILDEAPLASMMLRLQREMDPDEDSVRLYTICSRCAGQTQVLGQGEVYEHVDAIIV